MDSCCYLSAHMSFLKGIGFREFRVQGLKAQASPLLGCS